MTGDVTAFLDAISPGNYYSPEGDSITFREWAALLGHEGNRRVALSLTRRIAVSTVWLGLDHNWGSGPPHIFETMTFPRRPRDRAHYWDWQICEGYSTRKAALLGHERWLNRLRARDVSVLSDR